MKLFLSLITSLFLVSCGYNNPKADSKKLSEFPVKSNLINKTPLEVLGIYSIACGNLYVYKLGKDTIYLIEGANGSSAVSLQIK